MGRKVYAQTDDLQFQRGDCLLHLSSMEKLCVYVFVYNQHDYANTFQNMQLRMTDLATWSLFT